MDEPLASRLAHASQAFRSGELDQAEAICSQILQMDPSQADTWNLLAMIHFNTRRLDSAIGHLQQAVALRPGQALLHANLGEMLRTAGRWSEAEASYRRALELEPQQFPALMGLGISLCRQKQPAAGLAAFDRAVAIRPDAVEVHRNRGTALMELRRFEEAAAALAEAMRRGGASPEICIEQGRAYMQAASPYRASQSFERALQLHPQSADAYNGLGMAYKKMERFPEAVSCYQKAIAIRPDFVEALGNLGNALCELGRFDEAEQHCRQAVVLNPNSAWAHNSLGMALYKQARWQEAESELRQALHLDPNSLLVCQNLGTLLYERGRPFEAEPVLRRALEGNPQDDGLLCSLGNALQDMGRLDEAVASFDAALRANPDCVNARFNRSLVHLLRGEFATGWSEYEWRWKRTGAPKYGPFSQPAWQGEPLDGRTLLLHCEQGFGDTLQFIRFAKLVPKHGGRIVFVCPRTLLEVVCTAEAVDELVVEGEPLPPFDVHLPLLSLPSVLGLRREADIPATVPYLFADPRRVEAWRARLAGTSERKIGIVWQGNPQHTRNALRSIPLAEFLPLARVTGVQLYSLQKGAGREQLAAIDRQKSIIDLADDLIDFAETAALCEALDLVISCDSACAHLAGALGRSVWVALPAAPDWRWQLDREDSPWYPTMRLFRQQQLGDWPEVFARIALALHEPHRVA